VTIVLDSLQVWVITGARNPFPTSRAKQNSDPKCCRYLSNLLILVTVSLLVMTLVYH